MASRGRSMDQVSMSRGKDRQEGITIKNQELHCRTKHTPPTLLSEYINDP